MAFLRRISRVNTAIKSAVCWICIPVSERKVSKTCNYMSLCGLGLFDNRLCDEISVLVVCFFRYPSTLSWCTKRHFFATTDNLYYHVRPSLCTKLTSLYTGRHCQEKLAEFMGRSFVPPECQGMCKLVCHFIKSANWFVTLSSQKHDLHGRLH